MDVSKGSQFRGRIKKRIVHIFILIAVLCLALGHAAAKYSSSYQSQSRVITSDAFYFSTDLTGDSRMMSDENAGKNNSGSAGENLAGNYQFQPVQEETWHLYGGAEHEIRIELRNYYDSLRITQASIAYQAEIQTTGPDEDPEKSNTEETNQDLASLALIGKENQGADHAVSFLSGVLGAEAWQTNGSEKEESESDEIKSYGMEAEALTLYVKSHETVPYADGTTVKVMIKSISPYEKTIELNFVLHFTETELNYEIKDSVGSPYAELIIKNSIPEEAAGGSKVQPWLIWPKELIINRTNALTYTYSSSNSSFTQQTIESTDQRSHYKMQISKPLEVSESRSIYFFKKNTAQDYTQKWISVEPGDDGSYTIKVGDEQGTISEQKGIQEGTSDGSRLDVQSELPVQEVLLSPGKLYAGADEDRPVRITDQSSFTAQFTTIYVSGSDSGENGIKVSLKTKFNEIYLWDQQTSTAFTITETDSGIELLSVVKENVPQAVDDYVITKDNNTYQVKRNKNPEESESDLSGENDGQVEEEIGDKPAEEESAEKGSTETRAPGEENGDGSMSETEFQEEIQAVSEMETITEEEYVHNLKEAAHVQSDFTIPAGTVMTLIAQIDTNSAESANYAASANSSESVSSEITYWYYYCIKDTSEIMLSDFKQMNSAGTQEKGYDLYTASGGRIANNTNNQVTEKLIFLFDFENVQEDTACWWNGNSHEGNQNIAEGRLQLTHNSIVNNMEMEIMNGKEGSYPKTSESFQIKKDTEKVSAISISKTDLNQGVYVHDTYAFHIGLDLEQENGNSNIRFTDTRYMNCKYAVKLELVDHSSDTGTAGGNADEENTKAVVTRPFPEGTVFVCDNEILTVSENNSAVIIPFTQGNTDTGLNAGVSGDFDLEISTVLDPFHNGEDGTVTLQASLYVSQDTDYYNGLKISTSFVSFPVQADPEYDLYIGEDDGEGGEINDGNSRILEKGQTLSLGILLSAFGSVEDVSGTSETYGENALSVTAYRFDREQQNYSRIEWNSLFDQESGDINSDNLKDGRNTVKWQQSISENAQAGIYRLEFCYHDKTEYRDLIVR